LCGGSERRTTDVGRDEAVVLPYRLLATTTRRILWPTSRLVSLYESHGLRDRLLRRIALQCLPRVLHLSHRYEKLAAPLQRPGDACSV
jgi:hypothetical protein